MSANDNLVTDRAKEVDIRANRANFSRGPRVYGLNSRESRV